jgi:hypothetical protein
LARRCALSSGSHWRILYCRRRRCAG